MAARDPGAPNMPGAKRIISEETKGTAPARVSSKKLAVGKSKGLRSTQKHLETASEGQCETGDLRNCSTVHPHSDLT